ncbi:gluconate 2-dehydrogenase subunit 3 family protein [uncultured Fibrella sp.]|uniref:gluconate 2-dehydrogenase subunit 3 family protein n=1 Tax=uncultured Fibrella sp. TaxID=1284596 RepID=UPI0035C9610E
MSQPTTYPSGTVRTLLTTDHVSDKTRAVLTERLTKQPAPLRFFSEQEADTLRCIAARLIPQPIEAGNIVDLVGPVDERLANNESDGWRYDTLPADGVAFQQGLAGFHQSAQALYGQPFNLLTTNQQDTLIGQVQQGTAPGATWQQLPPKRFFEDLLAELVVIYFSHPLVQETIGYVGMADKPGWERIGLNDLEAREPQEV